MNVTRWKTSPSWNDEREKIFIGKLWFIKNWTHFRYKIYEGFQIDVDGKDRSDDTPGDKRDLRSLRKLLIVENFYHWDLRETADNIQEVETMTVVSSFNRSLITLMYVCRSWTRPLCLYSNFCTGGRSLEDPSLWHERARDHNIGVRSLICRDSKSKK